MALEAQGSQAWPVLQADDRRLAELHYKMCLTLQYLDQPEESLKEIKVRGAGLIHASSQTSC